MDVIRLRNFLDFLGDSEIERFMFTINAFDEMHSKRSFAAIISYI